MSSWYGVVTRDRIVRHVVFVCPRCGLDRDGSELAPRRWAAIAGLPVIPLGRPDHVIACNVCAHRCDLGVLEIPTTEVLAAYLADATRHSVVAILRAGRAPGGDVRRLAIETIRANGRDFDRDYDDDRLDADLTGLDDVDTVTALAKVGREMTSYGKQGFLHRLASLASSEGSVTSAQCSVLVEIGVALSMSADHINEVVSTVAAEVEVA